jgi:hypothetical protein
MHEHDFGAYPLIGEGIMFLIMTKRDKRKNISMSCFNVMTIPFIVPNTIAHLKKFTDGKQQQCSKCRRATK